MGQCSEVKKGEVSNRRVGRTTHSSERGGMMGCYIRGAGDAQPAWRGKNTSLIGEG